MLSELREMKAALTRAFDALEEELNELLALEDQLEDEHDEHIADLNEQMCSIAEWLSAVDSTIEKKEKAT